MSSVPKARLLALIEPVADGLEEMRTLIGAELQDASPAVSDMTDHISRFRGKQLRGAVTLLIGEAAGATTDEHSQVAAIVELIHLATLVHDDVLDGAEVRRRVACVNERWDNQVAVLLGDYLYARAFGLSTRLSSRFASRLLSETTRKICVGEIDQAARRYDFDLSQAEYEGIAGAKTAVLYAAACELGASYPSGDTAAGAQLRGFGYELGLAFQIVDDCLDVVGDPEVVGKSVGNDAEDGKITLPVLHTYATADEATRGRIRDVYTSPGLTRRAKHLREACDLETGVDYAMRRAGDLKDSALARLETLPPSAAKRSLEELCTFVLERRW